MLSQAELISLLDYNDSTGEFTHKINHRGPAKAGQKAGCVRPDGYVKIKIKGRPYVAHRLAWLYMTGEWPTKFIDHANRCRSDNRFSNLREATNGENMCNADLRKDNTSGAKGVSWSELYGKWQTNVCFRGKQHNVGRYDSFADAVSAVTKKRIELHAEFAHHC